MSVTNRLTVSALHGQGVVVTLDATDADATLPTLAVGQHCFNSSGRIGYVARVDKFGRTFVVSPQYPSGRFDSLSVPGSFVSGDTITLS
jgi:hypothetical protein